MPFFDPIRIGASGVADTTYSVDRSLRFNSGDSPYLAMTLASAGNRRKWTWSAWIKISNLGRKMLFSTPDGVYPTTTIEITSSNTLAFYNYDSGYQWELRPSRVLRDVGAWFHLVLVVDTPNSTSGDRVQVYFNGVRETSFSTETYPSQNLEGGINATVEHRIGHQTNRSGSHFDGYMAEINFIDGYAYDSSYFGETNSDTGQWNPKKYTGSYGTYGFYLNFSDNSGTSSTTLGKDSSGNDVDFTPNNFSVSAGEGNDSVTDTPTNNWCTLNSLDPDAVGTFSEGNLKCVGGAGFMAGSNFVVTSGKWYMEVKYVSGTSNHQWSIGFSSPDRSYKRQVRGGDGELTPNTGTVAVTFADPDIIMVALDVDNGKWYIGKNGSYMLSGDPVNGTGFVHSGLSSSEGFMLCMINNTSAGSQTIAANFGQQGFSYTPPTDFKALNSANLPDPTIKLPNKHFDTLLYTANGGTQNITGLNFNPDWVWGKSRSQAFYHDLYDTVRGDNLRIFSNDTNAEASGFLQFGVTGGFALSAGGNINDGTDSVVAWNWNGGDTDGKTYTVTVVSDSGNKYRFDGFGTSAVTLDLAEGGTYTFDGSDSSMSGHPFVIGTAANGSEYSTGVTYQLDGASVTYSQYTSGYSSATTRKLIITVPASAPQLYYWCSIHSGMGGAINTNSTLGSSNFDGTIQSTVKANTSGGFSIVTVTSDGTSFTTGHGLGVSPDVIIQKQRNASSDWYVYHKNIGATETVKLNEASAKSTSSDFGNTSPTSTVFTSNTTGVSGRQIIAYCFSEVAGYSKFGSYKGNGNSDGTFVFTGFRPAFLIIRNVNNSGDYWLLLDNKRRTFNPNGISSSLYANNSNAEGTFGSYTGIDFLSNGFKIRDSNARVNGSGQTIIYLAFAESPFKNARAR